MLSLFGHVAFYKIKDLAANMLNDSQACRERKDLTLRYANHMEDDR